MCSSTRLRFPSAISLGVTVNTFTPAITPGSVVTFIFSFRTGMPFSESCARAFTNALHSSADFGCVFHVGGSGAAMSARSCGLVVSGTGMSRAGTCRAGSSAHAENVMQATRVNASLRMAVPPLLLRNLRLLDHAGPALRLADEELAQLLGAARARLDAELGEALLHVGRGERLLELGVHAPDHRRGRLRRRGERVPRGDVVPRDPRLLHRRHVGQAGEALAGGHRQQALP